MVALLGEGAAIRLRSLPLTYSEVGATASAMPPGYRHLAHSTTLPRGAFEGAAELLMTWGMHERAGLRVRSSAPRVAPDEVVSMRVGPSLLGIDAVCRVVSVIEEPDRVGFAYGTLPGHPESGEEAFVLTRHDDEATFTIRAFSRPATRLARLGGPLSRRAQDHFTQRYLRAIDPERPRRRR
ncbi:DUF1990 family protein [Nocardioides limicola]|uniref:DUF1990 family protein n=1 Tax=Nocardioides limicola TaxID=2803368 RepID=UPI0027DE78B7|nr:DUF1990 domain-containing protein [Nocardioides sp. DJM-14]